MAKMTIGFGVALIALGLWGFVGTGSAHPTALIPVWFGLALAVAGALAITEDAKRRMLWMHIAVTVGLLGFLGAGSRAVVELTRAHGEPLADAAAVAVRFQTAMAVVCVVYVGLCVRSFIAARRGGSWRGKDAQNLKDAGLQPVSSRFRLTAPHGRPNVSPRWYDHFSRQE